MLQQCKISTKPYASMTLLLQQHHMLCHTIHAHSADPSHLELLHRILLKKQGKQGMQSGHLQCKTDAFDVPFKSGRNSEPDVASFERLKAWSIAASHATGMLRMLQHMSSLNALTEIACTVQSATQLQYSSDDKAESITHLILCGQLLLIRVSLLSSCSQPLHIGKRQLHHCLQ